MPPLTVGIPVITRPQSVGGGPKWPVQASRRYDGTPLPVKPSNQAPKNAQITGRILHEYGATYQLKIGDVEINDVGIEEILDYVSPLDLESYENQQFVEERGVLDALEAHKAKVKKEKLERQKERAKQKGVVIFEHELSTDDVSEDEEVEVGKYGRVRPSYAHLFKNPGAEGRRRRHSETGELMSLSDHEKGGISTENEPLRPQFVARQSTLPSELSKRRRRKRDKETGDLLPLSPVAQQPTGQSSKSEKKRGRRRRHPLTGELMPLGWHYDPDHDENTYEKRREGVGSHSFRKLSIAEGHQAKRQRLDTESSVSRSPSPMPTKAMLAAQHSPFKADVGTTPKASQSKQVVLEIESSVEESDNERQSLPVKRLISPSMVAMATPKLNNTKTVRPIISSGASPAPKETVRPQPHVNKIISPQQAQGLKTSIMNPSATRTSSTEPPAHASDTESEEDLDDNEWVIESILQHQQSDPKSHPPELGNEPVMLYLVKWAGFDETTWEPMESFGDRRVVTEYHKRVGVTSGESDADMDDNVNAPLVQAASVDTIQYRDATNHYQQGSTVVREDPDDRDDEEIEEDEFEIEDIMAHHLSDPRTHPPELGRKPVILYKVKWKNYDEPTWEPASSFEDKNVLQQYHNRFAGKS